MLPIRHSIEKVGFSPSVLDGIRFLESSNPLDSNAWERAYQIWSHAVELMNSSKDNSYRVDVITTLKRAVDHRLSLLEDIYKFDKIPIQPKPQRRLERLEYWGIIRPSMLKRLIDIRNAIEHEDEIPPEWDRCLEFVDFVWYFLRSTDSLCKQQVQEFMIENEVNHEFRWMNVKVDTNDWTIVVKGWCPAADFSFRETNNWIGIESVEYETRAEGLVRVQAIFSEERSDMYHHLKEGDQTDIFFSGRITRNENSIRRIVNIYLTLI